MTSRRGGLGTQVLKYPKEEREEGRTWAAFNTSPFQFLEGAAEWRVQ